LVGEGIWDQRRSHPVPSWFALLSTLIPIRFYAPHLGEPYQVLWTGEFKKLDSGSQEYELSKAVWEAVGSQTAAAADTIPSAFGSRVPNIAKDRPNVSAEMWSFWTLYLGPVLLRWRFTHIKFYKHFIQLVRLLSSSIDHLPPIRNLG
jgi:hypothetical protein